MKYLYGITDAPKGISIDRRGLGDGPVTVVHHREVGAVVGPADEPRYRPELDNLKAHEEVLETVMELHTVLPVRFSTVFSDDEAVFALLEERYDQFRSDLSRLRGMVELGVKALWRSGPSPGESGGPRDEASGDACEALSPGRRYLARRIQEVQRERLRFQEAEDLAREIHRPLSEVAVDTSFSVHPAPRIVFSGAYLVERDHAPLFRGLAEKIRAQTPEVIFLISGPWPPYSFVSDVKR